MMQNVAHAANWNDSSLRESLHSKKAVYISAGAHTGGDRFVQDYKVSNIRIGKHPEGYDRIVLDIVGNIQGENSILSRPPLFHVENTNQGKSVLVTLFGRSKLDFSTSFVAAQASKTDHIEGFAFFPLLEDDRWFFQVAVNKPVKTEVFELTQPARIIIDLK